MKLKKLLNNQLMEMNKEKYHKASQCAAKKAKKINLI